jgi:FMN phosphatase YigB (HAD superfamily)
LSRAEPGAVTFDFHDTLVVCDAWFDLEVHHLASAFLRWRATAGGAEEAPAALALADAEYRRLRRAIIAHGRELTAEACVARVLAAIGRADEPAAIEAGVAALMRGVLEEVRLVPGAARLVGELAAAGVKLGVVSSAVYHPFLEWSLDRLGVRQAFAVVTSSASAGYYKSRPEIFWRTIESLGVPAPRSVHVGDSYRYDVGGARRAGMKTVWLRRDGAEAEGEPPDLTLASLEHAGPAVLGLLAPPAA